MHEKYTTFTDHQATQSESCEVLVNVSRARGNVAFCATHESYALASAPTWEQARETFICDLDSRVRFIVEIDDSTRPYITDLTGLNSALIGLIKDPTYGPNVDRIDVWRWLGDGKTEPLTVVDGLHSEHDVWAITAPDGTEHLRVMRECFPTE